MHLNAMKPAKVKLVSTSSRGLFAKSDVSTAVGLNAPGRLAARSSRMAFGGEGSFLR